MRQHAYAQVVDQTRRVRCVRLGSMLLNGANPAHRVDETNRVPKAANAHGTIHGRQNMKSATDTATSTKQIHLTRRSPNYWRVTLDHPPLNIFGPATIPQLNEVI